jgi:hypothetical protein
MNLGGLNTMIRPAQPLPGETRPLVEAIARPADGGSCMRCDRFERARRSRLYKLGHWRVAP